MMKRIISICLVISVMLGTMMNIYAENTEKNTEIPIKELTVFNAIGITKEDLTDNYTGNEDIVTRAEFSVLLAKALKMNDESSERIYSDVPKEHQSVQSINALYKAGIIDPALDGKFNPNADITYEQALKMIICALGYNKVALIEGEKMTTYLATASKLGIELKGIKGTDKITYTQAIKLLYEGMFTNVLRPGNNGNFEVDEDETLFSIYYDLYEGEGVLTAVYGNEINSTANVRKNHIMVENTVYELVSGYSADDMLGEYCEYVYCDNSDGDTLVYYVESIEKKNEIVEISSELLIEYNSDSRSIEYYKDSSFSKVISENISSKTAVIYNGKVSTIGLSEIIKKFTEEEKRGEIKLVDNNKDGEFDILIATVYDLFVIGGYNETDGILYESSDPTKQFKIEDKDALLVLNQHSKETQIPTAAASVLLIAESEDGKYANVSICEKKVVGTVTGLDKEEKSVTLNTGDVISFDNNVWTNKNVNEVLNCEVTILLDKYGYGVDIAKSSTGGYKLLYLRQARVVADSGFDIYFKVFTEDGEHIQYKLAKKVSIDGTVYKKEEYRKIANAFPGTSNVNDANGDIKLSLEAQLIRAKLNGDNEITTIDTMTVSSKENRDNSLRQVYDAWLYYNASIPRFGLDSLYSATATKVFVAPDIDSEGMITINGQRTSETDDMYQIGYPFRYDTGYWLETYKYQSDTEVTDAIIYRPSPTIIDPIVYMFMDSGEMVGEDGDIVTYVDGYSNNGEKRWLVEDYVIEQVKDLEPGDLYFVYTDYQLKRVTSIKKVYDLGTDTFDNDGKNEFWYAGNFYIYGDWNYRNANPQASKTYLYEWKNNVMKGTYKKDELDIGVVNEVSPTNQGTVIVFDKDAPKEKVYKGSFGEAKTYKAYGEDCSKVITTLEGMYIRAYFIYK